MEDDDFSFDFESKLEEQQKTAASAPAHSSASAPASSAVPVNQSVGSFKRNYRQTVCTYWLKGVCALGENCGFLHEYNTERMPVCKTLIRFGICKEPDCPFKHSLEDVKGTFRSPAQECNMFKLGFCIYGPQCRYRHTQLPGPPPDPKTVDAAKPREFRAGGKDADREGPRKRNNRFPPYGRGRGDGGSSGRGAPRPPPPRQIEGERESFEPPKQRFERPPPPMPPGMPFGPPMMGMPGMMAGMMPGMPMGMMPPFWRGPPPMGRPFPPYGYR